MLKVEMPAQGGFLFRWRGYLPLFLLPFVAIAISEAGIEARFGELVEETWMAISALISLIGLGIRVATVAYTPAGTSGRNAREQRADELNTTGVYSVVRNPLYLGNYLMWLGIAMATQAWWLPVIMTFAFILYYERIIFAEERFLAEKFGVSYEGWAARTPLLVPRLSGWQKPRLSFSARNALRREYNGFYVLVICFTLVELGGDLLGEGISLAQWLKEDFYWVWIFAFGTLIYLGIRTLKRHTNVLTVTGR